MGACTIGWAIILGWPTIPELIGIWEVICCLSWGLNSGVYVGKFDSTLFISLSSSDENIISLIISVSVLSCLLLLLLLLFFLFFLDVLFEVFLEVFLSFLLPLTGLFFFTLVFLLGFLIDFLEAFLLPIIYISI